MIGREIRKALHKGELVYGTHVTNLNNFSAAAIVMNSGLDYVFICGEHMPLDSVTLGQMCQFYRAGGIAPVVRISRPDPAEATRALDLGAQGIVVPYVEKVEEVKAMAGAVHYRPLKGELLEPILNGGKVSPEYQAFFERFNADNFLIIGIESVPAYEHLDELMKVPGVDGIFLGPHDITVSIGHPEDWAHPAYQELVRNTIARARAAGLGVGVHMQPALFPVEKAQSLINLGMNWILDGSDAGWAAKCFSERRIALGLGQVKKSADNVFRSSCAEVKIMEMEVNG